MTTSTTTRTAREAAEHLNTSDPLAHEVHPSRLVAGDMIIGRHFRTRQRVIDCQLSRGRYVIGVADDHGRFAQVYVAREDTVQVVS